MFLLIDWGNSLLKYMEVADLSFAAIAQATIKQTDNLDHLKSNLAKNYQSILISSVRHNRENLELEKRLKRHSSNLFWAQTSTQACGVKCAYSQPQQLGVDRWLAVLAADKIAPSVAVISIGSAITFDVIKQHQHLGGQIVPGVKLLLAGLAQTGQVKAEPDFQQAKTFVLGQSTTACVHQGVETLIAQYLTELVRQSELQFQVDKILFCGGGGGDWANYFIADKQPVEHHPRLVFQGLLRLYLEQAAL